MLRTVTLFLMAIAFCGCDFRLFELRNRDLNPPEPPPPGIVDTYVPIYAAEGSDELKIATQAIRPTHKAGKIFVMDNRLFQVEQDSGIHIIDYSDKANPVKVAFLNVPGCKEVALKGSNVYTNNFEDMIILDLNTYPDIKVKSRMPNVFPELKYAPLPQLIMTGGTTIRYYECPDYSKGRIVRWEVQKVNNPKCRYY
ncbi:hypothetical protein GFS24_06620 [Chitinophaga sp. SYP-B3965]|uniref:hypothetical protein n=1 Tax=Chitinophaga sp. SYP-B3965 TaxID=2663120 RepID=UPI001299CC25|nr:hypothetical protein [Chitinophaga sp. SYP-B3965]MRG44779.1 hypothetical protein [Chitinophaga sp. SYP-B3965]